MGFFSFLDARPGIVRWAHKGFVAFRARHPHLSDSQIAQECLVFRYRVCASQTLKEYIAEHVIFVQTIHDLCYVVAEAECHDRKQVSEFYSTISPPPNWKHPVKETHRIIDEELAKLGY